MGREEGSIALQANNWINARLPSELARRAERTSGAMICIQLAVGS